MRDSRLLEEPPRRRLGCLVLLRNRWGQVLLLNPAHLDGMVLPGGPARPDEPPHAAAARSLRAQTGLVRRLGGLVAVDWTPADRYREGMVLVFDGGTVTAGDVARMTLGPPGETGILGAGFVDPAGLARVMSPAQAARAREALATRASPLPLLSCGQRDT